MKLFDCTGCGHPLFKSPDLKEYSIIKECPRCGMSHSFNDDCLIILKKKDKHRCSVCDFYLFKGRFKGEVNIKCGNCKEVVKIKLDK